MKNEIITQYSTTECYKTESLGIRIGQVVNNIKSPWETSFKFSSPKFAFC